jgi:hypothetical protein
MQAGVDKWEAAGFLGMSVEMVDRVSARRITDLYRLLRSRFGKIIPRTKAGREHARVMLHHLAYTPTLASAAGDLWICGVHG